MAEFCMSEKSVAKILEQYASKRETVFVFPTGPVMESWIDWCVKNSEKTGVSAVELDRSLVWEKFEERFTGLDSRRVTDAERRLFTADLIRRNAENKIFEKIITPSYADKADSFVDWIARILPELRSWKEKTEEKQYDFDEEDRDLEKLYEEYAGFLERNCVFEPLWEKIDISGSSDDFIFICPELYGDYVFRKDFFSGKICLHTWELAENIECLQYGDARSELRRTILSIGRLAEEENIKYSDIALVVPDLATYRPYLERELEKYCVPYVIKAGKPLAKEPSGKIFQEISNCCGSAFSFNALRSLIQSGTLLWKDEFREKAEELVRTGRELRCICGIKNTDSWEKALSNLNDDKSPSILDTYKSLKEKVEALFKAGSFEKILISWENFRKTFMNDKSDGDEVLLQCAAILRELSAAEKKLGLYPRNHFEFFLSHIKTKNFSEKKKNQGIVVYPYGETAGAAIKHQFVIDSSQQNLEIVKKTLGFLSDEKRKRLGAEDSVLSEACIALYAENPESSVKFSFCEEAFSGFAICHNALTEIKPDEKEAEQLDRNDFFLNEADIFKGNNGKKYILTEAQKENFKKWSSKLSKNEKYVPKTVLMKKINDFFSERRKKCEIDNEKPVVTQSDLADFYPCPRKWILNRVLKLKELQSESGLLERWDMGNINHRILELFFNNYRYLDEPLPEAGADGRFYDEEKIMDLVLKCAESALQNPNYTKSPLTDRMLQSQKETLAGNIMKFLRTFLKPCDAENKKERGAGGCKVIGTELDRCNRKETGRNYNLNGKIDCLLENKDGKLMIIDFKNTKSALPKVGDIKLKDLNDGFLGDFQMAAYVALVEENFDKDIASACFYSIKTDDTAAAIDENRKKSAESFNETLEAFEKCASYFAEAVGKGNFAPAVEELKSENGERVPVKPLNIGEICPKCDFASICRLYFKGGTDE